MPRRMLFPLRRSPGLVPIRELDRDIVVVLVVVGARGPARTLVGHTPSVPVLDAVR